jgi:hypothetical protein
VKPLLVVVGLLVALAGMGALAYVILRPSPQPEPTPPVIAPEPDPDRKSAAPPDLELRPYRTMNTLREDLRDALADDGANLDSETWRVSGLLESDARAFLSDVATAERSPRVRGLLVLVAGVHAADSGGQERFLQDRFPIVREAAVLSFGARPGAAGAEVRLYLDRVRVPLGRDLSAQVRSRLERMRQSERDERVLAALAAVLGS